jgi:bisphosphoglycerate-dependent phosphoglycerate mutase
MAKKKKKDKEKSSVETSTPNLDNVLKSSKKTQSTLHGLLKVVTEEKSFISLGKKEEKIAPQLSYETKKQIAEDYAMEQVPLSERTPLKKKIPISENSEAVKSSENADAQTSSTTKTPSFSKKENIYEKLTVFFEDVFEGYVDRYNQWENSISSILSILRKMRKITKKNTEELVTSVSGLYEKIHYNLDQFKLKRDEVEKITDVDVESMSHEFKKVLGLLELQVKEYQFKKLSDEFVHQQQSF